MELLRYLLRQRKKRFLEEEFNGASEASGDCFQSGEREEFPFFEGVAKFSTKILTG